MFMKVFLLTLALSYVTSRFHYCDNMFQPPYDPYKFTGSWIVHAVASIGERTLYINQRRTSSWITITGTGSEREVHRKDKANYTCYSSDGTLKILGEEIEIYYDGKPYPVVQTGRLYKVMNTPAIVWKGKVEWKTSPIEEPDIILTLMAQTSDVSPATMVLFDQMARCSNMEDTVKLDPTDLCDASGD
ncbi:hypothetical protein NL108_014461 [Boleophthalmus pectinirostris]|nr:hypothetical protein NL108_014461 [Boleophthalmus pectinirostris]